MQLLISLLALGFTTITADTSRQANIVGGTTAIISQYPSVAALLYSPNAIIFSQACTGTIITNKAILTAAHCVYGDAPSQWRARVGSSWTSSGGSVYLLNSIVTHPSFNRRTFDNDLAVLRTTATISYSNVVKPASIAGINYKLPDNQVVWAVGWGYAASGYFSDQLRHVQSYTVNQTTCVSQYAKFGAAVTPNMLCSGWPVVGGRDQCQGDSGGPLYHNGVVVGVSSWSYECANAAYPTVFARVSRFVSWIQFTV